MSAWALEGRGGDRTICLFLLIGQPFSLQQRREDGRDAGGELGGGVRDVMTSSTAAR